MHFFSKYEFKSIKINGVALWLGIKTYLLSKLKLLWTQMAAYKLNPTNRSSHFIPSCHAANADVL